MTTVPAPPQSRFSVRSREARLLLIGAVVLALGYIVAHALLISRFPWFVDETIFATFTQAVQGDRTQRFTALTDHKGLIVTWFGAVFVQLGITPMVALRLIAAASGFAAAAATGATVWRWMGSARAGLVTAAMVAFVPYLFVESSVGVYDAFIAGGSAIALALQLELVRRQRLDVAMLLGITFGMLILAKPTGALAIALTPFSLIMFDWSAPRRRIRLLQWCGLIGIALLITLCFFALPRLSPLAYSPTPDNHRTLSDLIHDPFGNVGTVWPYIWRTLFGYLSIPGCFFAVWGLAQTIQKRDRLGLVMAIWALAAFAAYLLLTDTAYPRYGLQLAAPATVLIYIGARDILARLQARFGRRSAFALGAVLALPALILDVTVLASPKTAHYPGLDRIQYVDGAANREPVREAAQEILKITGGHLAPSDPPGKPEVIGFAGWPWAAQLVLEGTHRGAQLKYPYAEAFSGPNPDTKQVNAARFLILEGVAPDWLDIRDAKLVRKWTRPHGGGSVVLYDRGPNR